MANKVLLVGQSMVPVITKHEHFSHAADIGVRGVGSTKAKAFEGAARALTEVVTNLEIVEADTPVDITCTGDDDELLLVAWLNELIYEMVTRKMLFRRFSVQIQSPDLKARAWGEPIDIKRHQPAAEIKGATFTALKVARREDGLWLAQCVVDV